MDLAELWVKSCEGKKLAGNQVFIFLNHGCTTQLSSLLSMPNSPPAVSAHQQDPSSQSFVDIVSDVAI